MAHDGQTSMGGRTAPDITPPPGGASPVRWSPDVVRRLDEEVEWALTSNPAGPAEVIGILLGQSGSSIQIRDCQPVFVIRERDRAYALSGPGRREFERKIALLRSIPERSVVGFYRSHLGDRLDLSEADLDLIHTCFQNTAQLVLLLKLTGDRSCSAKLFSGGRGQLLSEFNSPEQASGLPRWLELWQHLSAHVPRDASEGKGTASPAYTGFRPDAAPADTHLPATGVQPPPFAPTASAKPPGATAPPRTAATNAPRPEDTPSAPPEEVRGGSLTLERHSRPGPVFVLAAAAILAFLVGYLVLNGSARQKRTADTSADTANRVLSDRSHQSELALRADRDGEDLRLNWNHKAPVLAAATGGMLTIREGNGQEKQVMLDADLLKRGGIVYRPVHGEVVFRLVIFGQRGTNISESAAAFPTGTSITETDSNKERK